MGGCTLIREVDNLRRGLLKNILSRVNDPIPNPDPNLCKISPKKEPNLEERYSKSIFLGIAGGTASGKTSIAHKIGSFFSEDSLVISLDNYYKDLSHLSFTERKKINFDHPDSLDLVLLKKHLEMLREGKNIAQPTYDFTTSTRKPDEEIILIPKKLIIVEGILVLAIPEIRELFDMKVYVDAGDDIRLLRRLERDIKERERSFESVRDQYINTVKPMHTQFVEPSKQFADFIIPRGAQNKIAINLLISHLKELLLSPLGSSTR